MDRNRITLGGSGVGSWSLSARRAWIEIDFAGSAWVSEFVALRKESVDRNTNFCSASLFDLPVALRKESVDRNGPAGSYPPE